ncbi:MAG TPA: hypothetical protein VFJ85_05475 [Acidimicrobiales bacterium]|nr:hypothetical protein [Acidimicrobiales bacterium]
MKRLFLTQALRRGFIGGSRIWTLVGTLGIAMSVLRRITKQKPEVAFSAKLEPGQSLLISHDREAKVVRPRR